MLEFDENLIKYQKIFKVPEIQDLYFHFKQFNPHLPNNWHQLDLFKFNTYGLALLLGIDKEDLNKIKNSYNFTYYFLVERVDYVTKKCNKIEIFLVRVPTLASGRTRKVNGIEYLIADNNSPAFFYALNKVTSFKEEFIKKEDITLNRFLRLFNVEECKNASLPVPYSLAQKEKLLK